MTDTIYTPSHVANFILSKADEEKMEISPLKLLKLVYLIYGWVRAVLDRRLFEEEIQAWRLGPVVPSLYHEFKRFGHDPITTRSVCLDENEKTSTPAVPSTDSAVVIMEKAWDVYKPFPAIVLVSKTHEPDSPWAKHYRPNVHDIEIPDEEIKEYFKRKIAEYMSVAN